MKTLSARAFNICGNACARSIFNLFSEELIHLANWEHSHRIVLHLCVIIYEYIQLKCAHGNMAQTKYDRALKHSTQNDTLYISIAPEKNNDTCSKSNNNFGHKNQPNFLVIILLHYKCGTTFMHTRALGEHRTLKRIVGSHVTKWFSCDKIWRTILGAQH